jgi:hypothetical protein
VTTPTLLPGLPRGSVAYFYGLHQEDKSSLAIGTALSLAGLAKTWEIPKLPNGLKTQLITSDADRLRHFSNILLKRGGYPSLPSGGTLGGLTYSWKHYNEVIPPNNIAKRIANGTHILIWEDPVLRSEKEIERIEELAEEHQCAILLVCQAHPLLEGFCDVEYEAHTESKTIRISTISRSQKDLKMRKDQQGIITVTT